MKICRETTRQLAYTTTSVVHKRFQKRHLQHCLASLRFIVAVPRDKGNDNTAMVTTGVFTFVTAVVFVATPLRAQTEPADVKKEARILVTFVRNIVTTAREGALLTSILQDVLDLQNVSRNLLGQLPSKEISECETQHVIKMAAVGAGSHEILSVMTAEGDKNVLSARLGFALAFVSRVAQQIEDKLSLSSDIGPEVTAIIFGTNTTASIINSADKLLREKVVAVGQKIRSRREAGKLSRSVRSPQNSPWSANARVDVPAPGQWSVSGGLDFNRNGLTAGVSGAINSNRERQVQGNVGWESRDGRISAGVQGGVTWGQSGGPQPFVGAGVKIKLP